MTRLALLVVTSSCALLLSCAASPESKKDALKESSSMVMAGARCSGGVCTCREVDNLGRSAVGIAEGPIAPGHKRFELRTGRGLDPLRITVEGRGTLIKSVTMPESACAYIDLAPGRYRVRMVAEAAHPAEGIVPAVLISEYGEHTHDWYDTFRFKCGDPEACTKDDMANWFERVKAHMRGIFDPCGSVRVEGLRWSVEHSPEMRVEDLELEAVLNVYRFTPRFVHGTGTCKGLAGGKAAEDETAGF